MIVKSFHFQSCNFCFIDLRISKNLISFLNGHCSYVNTSDFGHVLCVDVFDYLAKNIHFVYQNLFCTYVWEPQVA